MTVALSNSVSPKGLSKEQVEARLALEGHNELPKAGRRTPFRVALEVLREPMLALLLGGGAIYLILGDLTEAVVLLVFATMSVVITVIQEVRTERVLDALRDLTSPRALVIRDGKQERIPGRDVVRGDIVVLAEGDRVPADAMLLQCQDLQADESLLTGESVPVRKTAETPPAAAGAHRPGGDGQPWIYSGSLIVRGTGVGEVVATGARSEIGKIGASLESLDMEPPRLQVQTRRLVRNFAVAGAIVSLLVVVLYGMSRGSWLNAVLAGIAVGMSMLPEEFPVVLTVFMAMGAWRISHARVLTRRAAAIETLGSATVLCTDKTGTLTENRMTVSALCLPSGEQVKVTGGTAIGLEAFGELIAFGSRASTPQTADPMERAFHDLSASSGAGAGFAGGRAVNLVHAYGLSPDLLAMSQAWAEAEDGSDATLAAKGAPEAIFALCRLDPATRLRWLQTVEAMAADGLRVLGVARATFAGRTWPETQRDLPFAFLGLVGLSDPLRASVPAAVAECRTAGIKVAMITGDYPATAQAIARQAGLDADDVVTGAELESMSDAALATRIRTATIFARIMPEQKLRIVQAFKAAGEIVAMTGDGVNDAPSLKAAHIGIAMGGRGTDVAREASSLVLLDDDFGSIVRAIRLGRRIYDNIRKAMEFIFAVHVPIAGLAVMPLLFGSPILLWPIHIAFLEMVIDPACSLAFEAEAEERDIMRRPPRDPAAPLFSARLVVWSLLQGTMTFGLVAAISMGALKQGLPADEVRALTFFALVFAILGLIFVNRSFKAFGTFAMHKRNRALLLIVIGVAAGLGLTVLWPPAHHLFGFGPVHWDDLTATAGGAALVFIGLESAKRFLGIRLWS